MRIRLVRRPGQHGTRAYVEQYGDRLVCVRYRYDAAAGRRYKTVEIIVDEAPWEPKASAQTSGRRPSGKTIVGVRVLLNEHALQQELRDAGAVWLLNLKLWQVPYARAVALGLADRVVGTIEELTAAHVSSDVRRRPS